ncbi:hypothetical protein T4B_945 [Trichinella pseudospiralis]|uniref:Uncharacterized protein n=1 Tax=Trichinella pseudospiralis TaxID=6337 RepID=A0A0V1H8F8_TRIPS|nr:hypothetical protein T4B_945 [Trichinella pseudospiralis]
MDDDGYHVYHIVLYLRDWQFQDRFMLKLMHSINDDLQQTSTVVYGSSPEKYDGSLPFCFGLEMGLIVICCSVRPNLFLKKIGSRTVNPDGNLPEENKKVEADTYTVTANPLQWDPVQEHLEKIEDFLLEILNLRVRSGYDRYGSDVSGDLFCCVFVLVHCVVTRYYAYMSVPTPSSSVNKTFVLLNSPFVLLGVTFRNERSSDCGQQSSLI